QRHDLGRSRQQLRALRALAGERAAELRLQPEGRFAPPGAAGSVTARRVGQHQCEPDEAGGEPEAPAQVRGAAGAQYGGGATAEVAGRPPRGLPAA
ncbi:unnamed protein product, partial [Effrenium voratum]